ncbi:unnamed protein product [Cylicocyclus nassatus]|uniref:Uncharacterized protein n=1 Tax=Cylicocyclus nassatus TaxID=53992 RepID=A0AA36DK32_CYLNA|nr:unnamed protein product [Cylicocyclus nassatus]
MDYSIGPNNPFHDVVPTSTEDFSIPILGWCSSNRNFFDSCVCAVSSNIDSRMKLIATRLLQLCDGFDEEFSEPCRRHFLGMLRLWRKSS